MGQAGAIALIQQEFEPMVVGADPFDVEWIAHKMDKAVHANSFAKGAVEMALLDLQGQILGVPVYQLIGGRSEPPGLPRRSEDPGIRLKFVVGAVEPALAAQRAKRMVDLGWKSK